MAIQIKFSVSVLIAVVLAEVFNLVWYSDLLPWARSGERDLIVSIIADIILVYALQFIASHYWSLRKWEDAAMLSAWLTLLYACLEAPHAVHDSRSFSRFFFHAAHKFLIMFIMSACLWHFKNY